MSSVLDALGAELCQEDPGACAAVIQDGRVSAQTCNGRSDLSTGTPNTPGTVFPIASLSKPLTALTVLKLVADGRLDLDGRVGHYLPHYDGEGSSARVRHLLTHTSGIPNFYLLAGFLDGPVRRHHTSQQIMDVFAPLPLQFEPGTRYGYSNSGYRLLDIIIEAVTHRPFAAALDEQVFAPAGMHASRVLDDQVAVDDRATGYQPDGDGWRSPSPISWSIPGGAGGVASTLDDFASFDRALWSMSLCDQRVLDLMAAPTSLQSGRTEGIGMGWVCTSYRGERILSFAGGITGFASFYCHLPDSGTSVVILGNRTDLKVYDLARSILDDIVPPVEPRRHDPLATASSIWDGAYADTLQTVRLAARGSEYELHDGSVVRQLRHLDASMLVDVADDAIWVRLHDEQPRAITVGYPLTWFTGYRDEASSPS